MVKERAKSKKRKLVKEPLKIEKKEKIEQVKKVEENIQITEKVEEPEVVGVREYLYALGRRKESSARVRLYTKGSGSIIVNHEPLEKYFPYYWHQQIIKAPLEAVGQDNKVDLTIIVNGGGVKGQAEAIRHGIARALLKLNPVFRRPLRRLGYLTRDPRVKERKKYGLKRARRAPQWQKR